MSVTTPSLIESLLIHDRPAAWWGLDTASPTADDSTFGNDRTPYTLTAIGTPANSTSLHTRGDTGASGSRDFNGSNGYWVASSLYEPASEPPTFVSRNSFLATGGVSPLVLLAPYGPFPADDQGIAAIGPVQEGDLMIAHLNSVAGGDTLATVPAGWTQEGSTTTYTQGTFAVYWRIATAVDEDHPKYIWTWTSGTDAIGTITAWRGVDGNVFFNSGLQATASSMDHATTSEAVPTGAAWQLVGWAGDFTGTLSRVPAAGGGEHNGIAVFDPTTVPGWVSLLKTHIAAYEYAPGDPLIRQAHTSVATTLGAMMLILAAPDVVVRDDLATISENFSCYFLCDPDTLSGTDTLIYKHQSIIVDCSGTTLRFRYRDGGGVDRTINGPTLSTAAGVYRIWIRDDGTTIYFTVNGTTTTAARVGAAGYTLNDFPWAIGIAYDGTTSSAGFDGRMDEVAIFPGFVSQDMVDAHEQAATLGTFGTVLHPNDSWRYPRGKLELALDSRPADEFQSFTDVTADVRRTIGIQHSIQRSGPLDRMTAGTSSFTLGNRDRVYDSVKTRRVCRFRVQIETDGPVYPRFRHYTEAPRHSRPSTGADATVSFSATDTFRALSLNKVQEEFNRPEERGGERIGALLEDVGGVRSRVDTGHHAIADAELQGVTRLEHQQAVAETEGGNFFADPEGILDFQDNRYRADNSGVSQATYGWPDTSATFPCSVFEPVVPEDRLYTQAVITPSSGNVQRAENLEASAEFFPLAKETTTLHASDTDALAMAHHIVNVYSQELEWVSELELFPAKHSDPQAMFEAVFGHRISDRITTIEEPPGGGEKVREHFIEGVTETVTASVWRVELALSPAELEGNYFVIGTDEIGDTEKVLGW